MHWQADDMHINLTDAQLVGWCAGGMDGASAASTGKKGSFLQDVELASEESATSTAATYDCPVCRKAHILDLDCLQVGCYMGYVDICEGKISSGTFSIEGLESLRRFLCTCFISKCTSAGSIPTPCAWLFLSH